MGARQIRLKSLLQQRHWQTYRTFCDEYDKAARKVDPRLVGTWPSRAQLHRWVSGNLKGLPYPDHCRILETMFPDFSAAQLFEPDQLARPTATESADAELVQVFEAVASGLDAPDAAGSEWEIASSARLARLAAGGSSIPVDIYGMDGIDHLAQEVGQRLVALKKVLRLSPEEMRLIADVSGHLIELELRLHIDIQKDGAAELSYYYELLNMSSKPVTRIVRESWFEYTSDGLDIEPVNDGDRRVVIQRLHDTPTMAKFACQISPPVKPGERAVIRYTVKGGQFRDHLYWRQTIRRYTRHLTISLRHRGVGPLTNCSAVEEHPDGAENSASEDLIWDYEGDDVTITLTRDYLRPNESVTLRWDIERKHA